MATLRDLQGALSIPLHRAFRSPAELSLELLPYLVRILNPDIKPVVVGGSGASSMISSAPGGSGTQGTGSVRRAPEKMRVSRAVEAMVACGVRFDRSRLEDTFSSDAGTGAATSLGKTGIATSSGWIYRMAPPLDSLSIFDTATVPIGGDKVRYAVRQVLDQEHAREITRRDHASREARMTAAIGAIADADTSTTLSNAASKRGKTNEEAALAAEAIAAAAKAAAARPAAGKRDFFGRTIVRSQTEGDGSEAERRGKDMTNADRGRDRIWVTFHEGYSNAVKKPVTMRELLEGL
jgi:chromosome transmission fidelity protein 18